MQYLNAGNKRSIAVSRIMEGGWGTLVLSPEQGGKTPFAIETIGSNAHECFVEGDIANGHSVVIPEPKEPGCVIRFVRQLRGIEVSTNGVDACRYYCGARAGYEGRYLRPPVGCGAAERDRTTQEFKRLYGERKFIEARNTLRPLLSRCAEVTNWLERGWLLNDLAITYYHLGQWAACIKTLEPLAKDAANSDENLNERLPPADSTNFLPIVKATRTNLRLCLSKKRCVERPKWCLMPRITSSVCFRDSLYVIASKAVPNDLQLLDTCSVRPNVMA
jgi:hypothetical protein